VIVAALYRALRVPNSTRASCGAGHIADRVKLDWLIGPHTRYFVREMRILAYAQLLESYQSVQLTSMAQAFGVSTDFLDMYVVRTSSLSGSHTRAHKQTD